MNRIYSIKNTLGQLEKQLSFINELNKCIKVYKAVDYAEKHIFIERYSNSLTYKYKQQTD